MEQGEDSKEGAVTVSATRKASGIRKPASKVRARKAASKAASKATSKAVSEPATGGKDSPIVLNCQYPTNTSSLRHALPAPRFTVAPAPPSFSAPIPPNFAAPGSLPRPHYYFHQFLANHDYLENTGSEQDSLFVTQAPAPWADVMASHGYGNQH